MVTSIAEMPLIQIVTPCFNEADGVERFLASVFEVLKSLPGYRFEILAVDDGSGDDTLRKLRHVASCDNRVKVYALSRNFGHQAALVAGLHQVSAQAAAVILMDSDLQHPPELISEMVEAWQEGAEIVSMVRRSHGGAGLTKRVLSRGYYWLMSRLSDVPLVAGAADFCLLGRDALNGLLQFEERDLFLRGAIAWLGFERHLIEFAAPVRVSGKSQYSFAKMMQLGLSGILSFSTSPIRLALKIGVVTICAATTYLLYALGVFAVDGAVRGWTSLMAVVVLFGGMNLLFIGIIGEYLGKTFQEAKRRPRYLMRSEPLQSACISPHHMVSRRLKTRSMDPVFPG